MSRLDARVLILGSMPGVASLEAQQYYAHPRNAFWAIMAKLTGVSATAPYSNRTDGLQRHQIALWDVMRQCQREGSLDADIEQKSIVTNDFELFFADHPQIKTVLFNGATAEKAYRRHVEPRLDVQPVSTRLPSTSPAMASLSLAEKQALWLQALT
ncbi:MAG: DNA-deoxyinosine glycosylase [bacterium]